MDTAHRETITKAAMAVNNAITAAIPVPQLVEEEADLGPQPTDPEPSTTESIVLEETKPLPDNDTDSEDDYYSDDEDYSTEHSVYMTMCREGLFIED